MIYSGAGGLGCAVYVRSEVTRQQQTTRSRGPMTRIGHALRAATVYERHAPSGIESK
jgi:hypothetical protein